VPHRAYADAVLCELEARRWLLEGATLASVFFGGGTPSLWEPRELGRVLSALRAAARSEVTELEVTVECNPSSLDRERAGALRAVGVNRLSIGVQSLDAGQLRFLGRLHDAQTALRAVAEARAEIDRVSADLMFGMPGQDPAQAAAEARALAELGLSHVSVYSLTIEPDTQFGQLHRKGRLPLAPEDSVAESFVAVGEALTGCGLSHYEVSNYAREGQQARHNQHYWRGGSYLGLGAGAVGCVRDAPGRARRYRNDPRPERYMADSARAEVEQESLGPQEIVRERLMLGLRTSEGVDLARARADAGVDPMAGRERALAAALSRGEVLSVGDTLRVPRERWLGLDSIIAALF
jgi:oxygen-independent coproporphyrinogen-3 oxidase